MASAPSDPTDFFTKANSEGNCQDLAFETLELSDTPGREDGSHSPLPVRLEQNEVVRTSSPALPATKLDRHNGPRPFGTQHAGGDQSNGVEVALRWTQRPAGGTGRPDLSRGLIDNRNPGAA